MSAGLPAVALTASGGWQRLAGSGGAAVATLSEKAPMTREFAFYVPGGGAASRYVRLRLRAQIELSRGSGPGDGYLEVETDGGPSGQFELLTRRRAGALSTAWDAVTTSGETGRLVHGRSISLAMTNYLVQSEWLPGMHWLRFHLDEFHQFHAAVARVWSSTALSLTNENPRPIEVGVAPSGRSRDQVAVSARNVATDTEFIKTVALRTPDGDVNAVIGGWPALRPSHVVTRVVRIPPGLAVGPAVAVVTTTHGRSLEPVGAAFSTSSASSHASRTDAAGPQPGSGVRRTPRAVYVVWIGALITLLAMRGLWSRSRNARSSRHAAR